jgi:hypothetical protein
MTELPRVNLVEKNLTVLSILLLTIGNSPLQNTVLGILGAGLSFIPLSLLLTIRLYLMVVVGKVGKIQIIAFILIIISSLIGSVLFIDDLAYSSFFKYLILYSLFFLPIFLKLDIEIYGYAFAFVFIITGLSFLVPGISESEFIHGTENLNMRFRGLYYEASHFAATFAALGLIVAIYFKKNLYVLVFIALFTFYVLFFVVDSKGVVASCLLAIIFMFVINNKFRTRTVVVSLALAVLIVVISIFFVIPKFTLYLETNNLTSLSTRLSGVIAGLYSLFLYPFGVGFTGFKPALIGIYSSLSNWEILSFLDFSEIETYISKNSNAVSTKNLVSDWFVFLGLPGVIFLYVFLKKIWASVKNDFLLAFSFVLLLIMLSSFTNGIGLYSLSFLLGVIISYVRKG